MKPVTLTPGFGDNAPSATLYYGQDVRESLRMLPEASVHTACTSPPYFGLRDYGTGDEQIGQEPTPEAFAEALVEVFRDLKRVLRPDGTLWVNLGDTYSRGSRGTVVSQGGLCANDRDGERYNFSSASANLGGHETIKPKDLLGIPWEVALALRADGWYLRSDIIWSKPNPMPESVKDRPTKAHEYIFLFSHPDSGGRYYYDSEAIKEPSTTGDTVVRGSGGVLGSLNKGLREDLTETHSGTTRNKRSVWNVNTRSYRGAHFATWPPELVRPMILAGCPMGGTVLDPFSGSATTGMVALQEGRNYVGIDLNADYLDLAKARVEGRSAPQEPTLDESEVDIFDLFGGVL
jgi:DNA modification methylase